MKERKIKMYDGHGNPTGQKFEYFENRTITVFGGTGTIGTLIVDYLLKEEPYSIRIFSNDENSLWETQAQLKKYKDNMRYILGDITNYNKVKKAVRHSDYVFNCAAIKHVPFAEYNPIEAVKTNILGLDNILNASVECNVKKVLQISTDKAVCPSTVMGSTKLIGERLLQVRWAQNNKDIQMVLVRLGNVYGSRGSIVPIIEKLKSEGKPITITDPAMTRFFMMPEDVVNFIMKAFRLGEHGEIWIPKLKPITLKKLVDNVAGEDYPIIVIGARRGEKKHELLLTHEELLNLKYQNKEYWIVSNSHPKSRQY